MSVPPGRPKGLTRPLRGQRAKRAWGAHVSPAGPPQGNDAPPPGQRAKRAWGVILNERLDHRRMAQECLRAGRCAVRAGLEDRDEIAGSRNGEVHPVGEQVERRAERSDHGRYLALRTFDPVADDDRVILAQHLSEVSRRGEVMVKPSVGDQEYLSARDLAVDDATHVKPRFADDVAAELD